MRLTSRVLFRDCIALRRNSSSLLEPGVVDQRTSRFFRAGNAIDSVEVTVVDSTSGAGEGPGDCLVSGAT